jgi:hypothetical protein
MSMSIMSGIAANITGRRPGDRRESSWKVDRAKLRTADIAQAAAYIQNLAPRRRRVKARIRSAAMLLNWSYVRTRSIWYKTARRIEAWELDQLRRSKAVTS